MLVAAVVPLATVAVAAVLKAGAWELTVSRNAVRLSPRPRPRCPLCKGAGGWWSEGLFPGGEVCDCLDRPVRTLRLLPQRDPWPDEPPF